MCVCVCVYVPYRRGRLLVVMMDLEVKLQRL